MPDRPFRRDKAAETLIAVAAALSAAWSTLAPDTRAAIARLIDEGGHDLFDQRANNRASSCAALLKKIGGVPDLPPEVAAALAAGVGESQAVLVRVSDEQHARVLAALVAVHDPRRYREPFALAEDLRRSISAHKGQLTPTLRSAWEQLDRAYQAGGSPDDYLDALDRLLSAAMPFVHAAIDAGRTWEPRHLAAARPPEGVRQDLTPDEVAFAGDDFAPASREGPPTNFAPPLATASPSTPPMLLQRKANVFFPRTVPRTQSMVPLIVYVARDAATGTVQVTQGRDTLTVAAGELQIFVQTTLDFQIDQVIGGAETPGNPYGRTVQVAATADSEPVVFFLSPSELCEPGEKTLSIEFFQSRKRVGALAFKVSVVEEPVVAAQLTNAVPDALRLSTRTTTTAVADPPDLDLRVLVQGNTLAYTLTSADGRYLQADLGQKPLHSDPQLYFASLTQALNQLASRSAGADSQRDVEELQALGIQLWDDLIPPKFAQVYTDDLRVNYAGKTLVITSGEPWIPWEMVQPRLLAGGQTVYIDKPWCEQFRLTRWLEGQGPREQLQIQRGLIVVPEDNLEYVKDEIAYFQPLAWTTAIHTVDQVIEAFAQGEAQLFHFSCHGSAGAGGFEQPSLKIGEAFLEPRFVISKSLKLFQSTPLIFLNACEAGQPAFTLTGLGGWAQTFIRLQASIFIGSLWAINDQLAAQFARSFYDHLWGRNGQAQKSVADAFHAARQAIKALAPGNPTWLAYVLYGDPNGRVYIAAP